jgi:hypothetical protein
MVDRDNINFDFGENGSVGFLALCAGEMSIHISRERHRWVTLSASQALRLADFIDQHYGRSLAKHRELPTPKEQP